MIHEEYDLSNKPADILSFDDFIRETGIVHGVFFGCGRSGKIHKFTKDVNLGYGIKRKFRGVFQWFTMERKVFISSISFILKIGIGYPVSFNCQSVTFRLSI